MNNVMWEIAEQHMDQGPGYHHYDPVFLKNYTEAIVFNCAQFIEDKFDFCGDELLIAEKLKEHFGIEE